MRYLLLGSGFSCVLLSSYKLWLSEWAKILKRKTVMNACDRWDIGQCHLPKSATYWWLWIVWRCRGRCVFVFNPCCFWLLISTFFKIAFTSGCKCCRGEHNPASILSSPLFSPVPLPHQAPVYSFPRGWNDYSNSPSLHWCSGQRQLQPSPPTHTHSPSDKAAREPEQNCLCSTDKLLQLFSCSHLALTGSPGLSYKPLCCVTGAIQA